MTKYTITAHLKSGQELTRSPLQQWKRVQDQVRDWLKLSTVSRVEVLEEVFGEYEHAGEYHYSTYIYERNKAAVALGSISTKKKATAARANGKKGGRPRLHG